MNKTNSIVGTVMLLALSTGVLLWPTNTPKTGSGLAPLFTNYVAWMTTDYGIEHTQLYGENVSIEAGTNYVVHVRSAATNGTVSVEYWNCFEVRPTFHLTIGTTTNRTYWLSFTTNTVNWVHALRIVGNGQPVSTIWDGSWTNRHFLIQET